MQMTASGSGATQWMFNVKRSAVRPWVSAAVMHALRWDGLRVGTTSNRSTHCGAPLTCTTAAPCYTPLGATPTR